MIKSLLIAAILALPLSPAFADPVTPERIDALPAATQPAWRDYLGHSRATAQADQAALQAELAANNLSAPLRAPDGGDFKLPAKPGDPYYASEEAAKLADILLSYQAPSGGWSKHTGYSRGPRKPGMQWTSQNAPGESAHYLATFDNRSTTEQLHFLAYVWQATKRDDVRAGFLKGLDYVLGAQYPNGGWPQVYPLEGAYHDDVTFNDDAMTHVLQLLQAIAADEPPYRLVDDARRAKAVAALAAGIRCVLNTQIEIHGKKTAWCAQYDALTLKPSNARAMEPATLSGAESARILQFLMSIPSPSPDVVAAIEGGLAWLESAKITGLTRTTLDGKTAYIPDSASTEIFWARFYDLKTGRPVFPGRDGILYDTFDAMAANNRVGYDYYSTLPGSVLTTAQKQWRRRLTTPQKP
jgi:PelA/Pel-15E family pectate lyase